MPDLSFDFADSKPVAPPAPAAAAARPAQTIAPAAPGKTDDNAGNKSDDKPALDPLSPEAIEAEFARLLGRSPPRKG
ncbi:hypothetical protein GCM10019059_15120 [Camelimonas fluminis]|nr:hypothetical protein GCM10019059_15120 [Camelimonas fluminis]